MVRNRGGKNKKRKGDETFTIEDMHFTLPEAWEKMRDFYQRNQYLIISRAFPRENRFNSKRAMDAFYKAVPDAVNRTYTVENDDVVAFEDAIEDYDEDGDEVLVCGRCLREPPNAQAVFGTNGCPHEDGHWYISFIAQGTTEAKNQRAYTCALDAFTKALPLRSITELGEGGGDVDTHHTTAPIWCFIGKATDRNISGRPDHIDSVSHDGTWHFQAQGRKDWVVHPSDSGEWGDKRPVLPKNNKYLQLSIEEGDVLCINTRLWWHQTILNPGPELVISYARDFYDPAMARPNKDKYIKLDNDKNEEDVAGERDEEYMNADGIYASRDFDAGEVVLVEADLPDCALPRADDANCEVGELPDGQMALVSRMSIKAGDWLTVAPSDNESDAESDDEVDSGSDDEESLEDGASGE